MQWWILHSAIATNCLVSTINVNIVSRCLYDSMFTESSRWTPFCSFLPVVFSIFGVQFAALVFISGLKYNRREKSKVPNFELPRDAVKMVILS